MKKKPGLSVLRRLLAELGNPQDSLRFIHIAGTNGKGSAATYISDALTASGYKCGKYISPFVINFYERISVDGSFITDRELSVILKRIRSCDIEGLTEFELITACAFCYYKEKKCDAVVLEAGIGGSHDATNVIEKPVCSVLTKIDYDHMSILGDTIEKITEDKCGIIKNGAVISYPFQRPESLSIIKKKAEQTGCEFIIPGTDDIKIISCGLSGNRFLYKGKEMSTGLVGEHQIYNALTAFETLSYLNRSGNYILPEEVIIKSISESVFPARMEVFNTGNTVILDGAHNADGMRTLCSSVGKICKDKKIKVILGVFKDKDYSEEIRILSDITSEFITVSPPGPRALDSDELSLKIKTLSGLESESFGENYSKAIKYAEKTSRSDTVILICGSLHLASAVRDILIKKEKKRETKTD